MSCKRNRGYRMRDAIQVRSLVFPWTRTRKTMASLVLKHTERSMGSHSQRNDRYLKKTSHPIFYWAEHFSKRDLKCKKGKQTLYFQSTTQTKSIIMRTLWACNQLCTCVEVCDWFDRYNRNQKAHPREGLEPSTEDLTNLTH